MIQLQISLPSKVILDNLDGTKTSAFTKDILVDASTFIAARAVYLEKRALEVKAPSKEVSFKTFVEYICADITSQFYEDLMTYKDNVQLLSEAYHSFLNGSDISLPNTEYSQTVFMCCIEWAIDHNVVEIDYYED